MTLFQGHLAQSVRRRLPLALALAALGVLALALAASTASAAAGDFRIEALPATNSRDFDHNAYTGDDRGGIAISSTHVFYSGDYSTGRFTLDTLAPATVGRIYDALVSDLRTGRVYTFGAGSAPIGQGGTITTLIEIDGASGALTGRVTPLSRSIPASGGAGIFAGFERAVLATNGRVYDIVFATGAVTDLGAMALPDRTGCESWATWGVAERANGVTSLVYVRDPRTIGRVVVPTGSVSVVSTFTNLGDMCSFTVHVPTGRWYFHHEFGTQFGGGYENVGYADAVLTAVVADPPSPPRAFAAAAGARARTVALSWGAPESDGGAPITGYRVYRAAEGGAFARVADLPATARGFEDAGLTMGATYLYHVRAANEVAEGAPTATVAVRVPTPPTAPRDATAARGPASGAISVSWRAPETDGGSPLTGYVLYRGTADGALARHAEVPPRETRYVDGGLRPGETFVYRVAAVNGPGEGPLSAPARAQAPLGVVVAGGALEVGVPGAGTPDVDERRVETPRDAGTCPVDACSAPTTVDPVVVVVPGQPGGPLETPEVAVPGTCVPFAACAGPVGVAPTGLGMLPSRDEVTVAAPGGEAPAACSVAGSLCATLPLGEPAGATVPGAKGAPLAEPTTVRVVVEGTGVLVDPAPRAGWIGPIAVPVPLEGVGVVPVTVCPTGCLVYDWDGETTGRVAVTVEAGATRESVAVPLATAA